MVEDFFIFVDFIVWIGLECLVFKVMGVVMKDELLFVIVYIFL